MIIYLSWQDSEGSPVLVDGKRLYLADYDGECPAFTTDPAKADKAVSYNRASFILAGLDLSAAEEGDHGEL
jgi:hypothetical protein